MTTLLDSEIVYDRTTRDYSILIAGVICASAPNYSAAEAIRTQLLSERRDEGVYATAGELDGAAVPDDQPADSYDDVPAGPGEPTYHVRCSNCGDAHPIQKCPEVLAALANPGRAVYKHVHTQPRQFIAAYRRWSGDDRLAVARVYADYRGWPIARALAVWDKALMGPQLPPRAA